MVNFFSAFVCVLLCGFAGPIPVSAPSQAVPVVNRTLCRQSVCLPSSASLRNAHESRVPNRTQSPIGDSAADNGAKHFRKPLAVRQLPPVEPPDLLVQVAEEMKRRGPDVRAFERSLDAGPEVFHPVDMNAATDIGDGVIYGLVDVLERQSRIALVSVGIDNGASIDVAGDFRDQRIAFRVRDDRRPVECWPSLPRSSSPWTMALPTDPRPRIFRSRTLACMFRDSPPM